MRSLYEARALELSRVVQERDAWMAKVHEAGDYAIRYETLKLRASSLIEQCFGLSATLDRLVAEAGRMPPPADTDPTDPRLFLLQQWHSTEVKLTQEIKELKDSVPWVIDAELDKIRAHYLQ